MADLNTLSTEFEKLKKQIKAIMNISGYQEDEDLSKISDYDKIESADDWQKIEEYKNMLYKLDEVQRTLMYYDRPVIEVSQLHQNESGRYETDKGHYYTSGCAIEFLRTEERFNSDTDVWETIEIWTSSRIESRNGEYYIVGYPDTQLSELTVRRRK